MKQGYIQLPNTPAPTVELDTEARAAYIRFSKEDVARTEEIASVPYTVTVDFDKNGEVIGLELVGVEEFSIESLVKEAKLKMPVISGQKVSYVVTPQAGRAAAHAKHRKLAATPRLREAACGVKSGQKTLEKIIRKAGG